MELLIAFTIMSFMLDGAYKTWRWWQWAVVWSVLIWVLFRIY